MLSHCVGRPTRRGVIAIALMTPGPVSTTIRGLLTDLSPVRRTDREHTRVLDADPDLITPGHARFGDRSDPRPNRVCNRPTPLIASSAITKTRRIPEACPPGYPPTFKSFSVKSCCLMNFLNHGPSTSLVS